MNNKSSKFNKSGDINDIVRRTALRQYDNLQFKLRRTDSIKERQEIYNQWLIESRQENKDIREQYKKENGLIWEQQLPVELVGEFRELRKERESEREAR